jgi:hypothetical protein
MIIQISNGSDFDHWGVWQTGIDDTIRFRDPGLLTFFTIFRSKFIQNFHFGFKLSLGLKLWGFWAF